MPDRVWIDKFDLLKLWRGLENILRQSAIAISLIPSEKPVDLLSEE